MPTNEFIASLIIKHLNGTLSAEEHQELERCIDQSERRQHIVDEFFETDRLERGIWEHWVEDRIWARLLGLTEETPVAPRHRIRARRYLVAASILLLLGLGVYFWRASWMHPSPVAVSATVKQDVAAPVHVKATITLSDGRMVAVDSLSTGTLASQGHMQIVKQANGDVEYNSQDQKQDVFFNTLSNPRGSRVVTLVLADQTKVWLNAASSIRYPTAFAGTTREVEVEGEAYFEVAKNTARPFKVKINGKQEVEVLGTSFNVKGYADEPLVKITLLEGSVKVKGEAGNVLLKPGQQAQFSVGVNTGDTKGMEVLSAIDVESVLAWKNGRFQFDGIGIHEVMRELARWYDVEVAFQGTIRDQHFRGGIPRSANVSSVFQMLESTGVVHFSVNDKKIIVMP